MTQRPNDPTTPRVPAIVLAGGKTSPEFAAEAGSPQRALAEINGWPMVRYVLHALREAETVSRVILVAPSGFPAEPEADEQVAGDGGLVENLEAGLARCGGSTHALLVTADIPFLSPASIDDYVRTCAALDVDCCYAAIPRAACQEHFPEMKRTYLRIGDDALTGGNVVLQRIAAFPRQAELLRKAYQQRKNPLFLASLIGPGNVWKFLLRRLTLEDIGREVSRIIGAECRLVQTPHADLGTDVDRPEDLALARQRLQPPVESGAGGVPPSTRETLKT